MQFQWSYLRFSSLQSWGGNRGATAQFSVFFHLVPHSFANQKGIRQWRSNQKQCTHTSQYLAILRNSKEAKVSTNQPGVESLSLASEFGQNMNSYRSEIKNHLSSSNHMNKNHHSLGKNTYWLLTFFTWSKDKSPSISQARWLLAAVHPKKQGQISA